MKKIITSANFLDYKLQIINACSIFGKINHPDTWAESLNIFEFDESAEDMASSLLVDLYYLQLKSL
jgi:hypothetical protein